MESAFMYLEGQQFVFPLFLDFSILLGFETSRKEFFLIGKGSTIGAPFIFGRHLDLRLYEGRMNEKK